MADSDINDLSPSAASQTLGGRTPWAEVNASYFGDGNGGRIEASVLLGVKPALDSLALRMDAVEAAGPYAAGALPVGTPCLLAHRRDELPDGYWFPSGDYFPLESAVGRVLNAFSETYKADWGIAAQDDSIRLYDPELFFAEGCGRFFRPVDGIARHPGSREDDAIRDIVGNLNSYGSTYGIIAKYGDYATQNTGAFTMGAARPCAVGYNGSYNGFDAEFRASLTVPTAPENRPRNVGLTPAVYLGVTHA